MLQMGFFFVWIFKAYAITINKTWLHFFLLASLVESEMEDVDYI